MTQVFELADIDRAGHLTKRATIHRTASGSFLWMVHLSQPVETLSGIASDRTSAAERMVAALREAGDRFPEAARP